MSAALFRHPAWLYPAVAAGLVAYLATGYALDPALRFTRAMASLVAPIWSVLAAAYAVVRWRLSTAGGLRWRSLAGGHAASHPWAAPLYLLGLAALALSTAGSLVDARAGLWTAVAYAVLLAGLATLWPGVREVWGSLTLTAVASSTACASSRRH